MKQQENSLVEEKIIGLSVQDREEAILAEKAGADYVGLGPIFDTATKKDAGKDSALKKYERLKVQ